MVYVAPRFEFPAPSPATRPTRITRRSELVRSDRVYKDVIQAIAAKRPAVIERIERRIWEQGAVYPRSGLLGGAFKDLSQLSSSRISDIFSAVSFPQSHHSFFTKSASGPGRVCHPSAGMAS
jgi:hypothetical protein